MRVKQSTVWLDEKDLRKMYVRRGTSEGEEKIARQPKNKSDLNGDHDKHITENLMEQNQGSEENRQKLHGV